MICSKPWKLGEQREKVQGNEEGKQRVNCLRKGQKEKRKRCSNYGWSCGGSLITSDTALQTYKVSAPRMRGPLAITPEALARPGNLPAHSPLIDN